MTSKEYIGTKGGFDRKRIKGNMKKLKVAAIEDHKETLMVKEEETKKKSRQHLSC